MKVAVVFRGKLDDGARPIDKIQKVLESHRNYFAPHNIDFYAHLWDFSLSIGDVTVVSDANSAYKDEIDNVIAVTRTSGADREFFTSNGSFTEVQNRQYAQISSAISIKKTADILNLSEYDMICLSRLDLVLTNQWENRPPTTDEVGANTHGINPLAGDYIFLLHPLRYKEFCGLYDFYTAYPDKISPEYHKWMLYYATHIMKLQLFYMNVDVPTNAEIWRHL
jgi:hypothetical protein